MNILKIIKIIYKKFLFNFSLNYYRLINKEIKLLIGGGKTKFNNWIYTNIYILDIRNENNWKKYFKKDEISNILAEHVFEHLTINESEISLSNCYKYLKNNGKIRIAVPDGYFPDNQYIEEVKPGGSGDGSYDHKILYNYETLSNLLEKVGFHIQLLEYFNNSGKFNKINWDINDGYIFRSLDYDHRNKNGIKYTSLIIDGIKKI